MLQDYEEVVPECEGCDKINYSIILKRNICTCHIFPRSKWWLGTCDQATHHPPKKPTEDPIKEP